MSEEEKYDFREYIPANYENFGKLLGGSIGIRNAVECLFLAGPITAIERFIFLPDNPKYFAISLVLISIPLAVICIMGVNGDSFLQFMRLVFIYSKGKKEYRYRRIQSATVKENKSKKAKKKKVKLKK